MDIERLQATIAPRHHWQAMDMGTRLYQAWWKPITLIWLATTAPIFLLMLFIGEHASLIILFVIFWWLKPLWERPLLEYYSRALFSGPLSPWKVLKEWPHYGLRGVLPFLLWRRFDPARSVHASIAQLERQRGNEYAMRRRLIDSGQPHRGGLLTILMVHIEQLISYTFFILLMMLIPNQYYLDEVQWYFQTGEENGTLAMLCWYAAITLTQPLYVACGFALYLNKRTWMEGWDLENGLKRIGLRRQKIHTAPAIAIIAGLLISSLASEPASARRADTDSSSADTYQISTHQNTTYHNSTYQHTIRQSTIDIVASEEFMPIEVITHWRLREAPDQEDDDTTESWLSRFLGWLMKSGHSEHSPHWYQRPEDWIRLLLWGVTLALTGWLVWRYRYWLAEVTFRQSSKPIPLMIGGLDLHEESLPDDVPAAIRAALQHNNIRLALSILYRAILLSIHQQTPIPAGLTEQECLDHVRAYHRGSADVEILSQITPLWSRHAWGHQPVATDSIEQLTQRFENERHQQRGASL